MACSAVGLLHDVGHPPFSHALERVIEQNLNIFYGPNPPDELVNSELGYNFHEKVGIITTTKILDSLKNNDPKLVAITSIVERVYLSAKSDGSWASCMKSLVAGDLDVDRLDYLARDSLYAGTEYGALNLELLIGSLEIHEDTDHGFQLAPGVRGRSAAEKILVERSQSYKYVYFHSATVGFDLCISRAIDILIQIETGPVGSLDIPSKEPCGRKITNLFREIRPRLDQVTDIGILSQSERPFDRELQSILDYASNITSNAEVQKWHEDEAAFIDDGTVLEWIKQGMRLAKALRLGGIDKDQLDLLIFYSEAILFRNKQFVIGWKSHEDFSGLAALLNVDKKLHDLIRSAAIKVSEFAPEMESNTNLKTEGFITSLSRDSRSVSALNRFLIDTISIDNGKMLREYLNQNATESRHGAPKQYWDIGIRSHGLRDGRSQLGFVWKSREDGTTTREELVDTSPLVASIPQVDNSRIAVFAYLWLGGGPKVSRESVQMRFATALREYVGEHYHWILARSLGIPGYPTPFDNQVEE